MVTRTPSRRLSDGTPTVPSVGAPLRARPGLRPARPTELAHRDLEAGGEYQWRREGEFHLFNPTTVHKLQHPTRHRRHDRGRDRHDRPDDVPAQRDVLQHEATPQQGQLRAGLG